MLSDLHVCSVRLSRELPRGSYLHDLPVVRHLKQMGMLRFHSPVTFFVGENGTGKSTLMEAIAVNMGFNPEGGTVNFNFATEDSHSELYDYISVGKGFSRRRDGFFLRAESFYNVASNIDQLERTPFCGGLLDSYGGKSLHRQSHGESFLSLVENRFGGDGIYILDEPEAALSPSKMLELMYQIHHLVGKNSQFLIATHSPILMAYPGAEVLLLSEEGIQSVDYRETEHFQLTRQFLNAPEAMFRYLFEEK